MTIDKQKLQRLLWAEAASYRADCADWKRNTEALQEFLGEKTVEEVALELLAESERLVAFEEAYATACDVRNRLIKENEALHKDAERYRWLQHGHSGYIEVVEWIGPHATGMTGDDLDTLVDTAMSQAVQP
ncbi:hypothetical protein PS732_02464 [Pseudomonas fluorescens]|uniref:Ead/Ea22-like family protein n=1 Tax=Pseudomonas fluorescens TaxID=294 RepID=A0ABD7VFM6_PSEFL|nr:hypothetical protein [Pseudomonas fluorescens]VVO93155.1 hypothetical protein PS732_02464 [Pseudomonas fluorescens]